MRMWYRVEQGEIVAVRSKGAGIKVMMLMCCSR